MKMIKKLLSLLLVFVMVLSMAAGCSKEKPDATTGTGGSTADQGSYSVSLQTQGGMALAGVDVYVYADDSLGDLVTYGQTDENGQVSFQLAKKDGYAVELKGLPTGYQVADSYAFTGNAANITLTSSPVTGESLSGATLGLGDVIYDFTVTTPDGKSLTLSEILKEKELVVLNFWYTTCSWCLTEFPYMQTAYEQYGEDVEIIALNPLEQDAAIKSFQTAQGLTFPMAACNATWSATFGVTGYPTSVFIDRYGVICLVESGAITSQRPFTCAFEHFIAEDYKQTLCQSIGDLVTDVKPSYTMDTSENISAAVNQGDITVTYRPETEDSNAEYSWPFVITEKDGKTCLKASNQQIDSSYAILYADVELKAGQAVGFDYLASSEALCDILYVIVNDEDIYQISGTNAGGEWKACYPCVALEDGTYEIALCYLKDSSTSEGDDTVYIKDVRVVDSADIEVATYLPRYPAATEDGLEYTYEEVFYNEADGYYHVGSVNGPLLLADLMGYTAFSEEKSVYFMVYDGDVLVNGESYYDVILPYFTRASNSALNGVVTVDKELAEHLKLIASIAGFDGTEDEWLKICKYYQVYGAGASQLQDPTQGLSTEHPLKATQGKNVQTNYFYYDRPILPRGLLAEFVPTRSGVYRITSRTDDDLDVDGWIFDKNGEIVYTYEYAERMNEDDINVSMVYYMEAGTPYYIDIAFWDMYQTGYIYYDIEYIAPEYDLFRLASPGYFTYDTNATGDQLYQTIAGGIDVVLGDDGYYYEDLGGGRKGSKLYADFTGTTGIFSVAFVTVYAYDKDGNILLNEDGSKVEIKGLIDSGYFDFSKTEQDHEILTYMAINGNDVAATEEYLKALWGEDYDAYAAEYQIEDVFAGRYHGKGEDLTEEVRAFAAQMIVSNDERNGCVVVTEELAELLQKIMDKCTFNGVEHSWTKLCYYYQHFGPEA